MAYNQKNPKSFEACKLPHNLCWKYKSGSVRRCCCFCEHARSCKSVCLNDPKICGQNYTHVLGSRDPAERGI